MFAAGAVKTLSTGVARHSEPTGQSAGDVQRVPNTWNYFDLWIRRGTSVV